MEKEIFGPLSAEEIGSFLQARICEGRALAEEIAALICVAGFSLLKEAGESSLVH